MKLLALFPLIAAVISPSSGTGDDVFRALEDELHRMPQLQVGSAPSPFFSSYSVHETREFVVAASLGGLTERVDDHRRYLVPDIRIGTPKIDNTNFFSAPVSAVQVNGALPIDSSYPALRRTIWLLTDKAYKDAVQNLQAKRAWLQQNKTTDRLDDFRAEPAVVSISDAPELVVDRPATTARVVELSKIFKDYPHIQTSSLELTARAVKRWFVSTEGSKIHTGHVECGMTISASGQAADGEKIGDCDVIYAATADALLKDRSLEQRVKQLAERVEKLCSAPASEEYLGPVLFEGQAAASLISQLLAPNLGFPVEQLGSRDSDWRNPFANARGRKIMSPFLSIVDDPTMQVYDSKDAVRGGYDFDSDGIRGQKITLIDHGILKTLCTSRTPTKWGDHSNGHSFCGTGWPSILFLSSEKQIPFAKLKERLIELGKEDGLDYVIILRRIQNYYGMSEVPPANMPTQPLDLDTPSSSRQPTDPIGVYKVYVSDGHEELVRGLEFRYTSMRAFRDIDCTGDDTSAQPVQVGGEPLKHLITPSLIVKEIEFQPVKKENEDLPLLPSPLHPAAAPGE